MDVFDNLLANLNGIVPLSLPYMTKEEAHRQLVLLAGADYGFDDAVWRSNKEEILARIPRLDDESCRRKETELRKRWRQQQQPNDRQV